MKVIVDFNEELKKKKADLEQLKSGNGKRPKDWPKYRIHLERQIRFLERITKERMV